MELLSVYANFGGVRMSLQLWAGTYICIVVCVEYIPVSCSQCEQTAKLVNLRTQHQIGNNDEQLQKEHELIEQVVDECHNCLQELAGGKEAQQTKSFQGDYRVLITVGSK